MSDAMREIEEAVRRAAAEARQPTQLADRISAWLRQLTEGNETLEDADAADRHIEALYQAATTAGKQKE